jgi:peptidyl-tRNA hydrolase, PTH1 family
VDGSPVSEQPWLVVGLGNPGPSYALTRHNVGRVVVEVLAGRVGRTFKAHRRSRTDVVEARLGDAPGTRVILARSRAYMNESGASIASVCDFYRVDIDRLVVVHDELDLPYGSLRIKLGGGDNGHNGLRSVRGALGTGDFHRVRFGIGRPPGRMDPAAFVLKPFSATERVDLPLHSERAADAVEALVVDGLSYAQDHYNG